MTSSLPSQSDPPAPRTVVGAILVDDLRRPRRVLAARRSEPGPLQGRWEFPGGKVEPGESLFGALSRELWEELALTVEIGTELRPGSGDAWPISAALELRLFFATVRTGEPAPGPVHDAVQWLAPDRLADVRWLDSNADAVATLRRALAAG